VLALQSIPVLHLKQQIGIVLLGILPNKKEMKIQKAMLLSMHCSRKSIPRDLMKSREL
jgi:hypothetical protein